MRPVVRGPCPQDDAGQDIIFKAYTNARSEMIKRLGEYCSYCEMHLDASLAIEHIQPKQPPGAASAITQRELCWDNFLLACTNCNSTKGNTEVTLDDSLWPDRDNTFLALTYSEGGRVTSKPSPVKAQADKLISLVGLQKSPDTADASDRRWLNRKEAWDMATRARERLARNRQHDMKEQIVDTACANGYWSIWMTVFKNDPDMLARLIAKMPGTSQECFDAANNYAPRQRLGGLC